MRILLFGMGSIGLKHIDALLNINPKFQIQAFRSSANPSINHPTVRNIYSLSEVDSPDFIMICNPTIFHKKTLESAFQFKVPIFIEKPLFHTTTKEEKKLIEKIKSEGISTYVACNLRFHPVIEFLKNGWINHSRINEVNIYCGSYLPEWRTADYKNYYSVNSQLGGGVHLDLIHEYDYATYLFGYPNHVVNFRSSSSSLQIESIDYTHSVFKYQDFYLTITLNYFRRDPSRYIEILTNKETLKIDLLACKIYNVTKQEIIFSESEYNIMSTYKKQMIYFIEHMNDRLMNNVEEAFKVLELALL